MGVMLLVDINDKRTNYLVNQGYEVINTKNITDLKSFIINFFNGECPDSVIICTASNDNSILNTSANILRKRGRIVLVGTSGLKIDRDEFYKKEISFQVSYIWPWSMNIIMKINTMTIFKLRSLDTKEILKQFLI